MTKTCNEFNELCQEMERMEEMMATLQRDNEELKRTIKSAGKKAEEKKSSENGDPENRV